MSESIDHESVRDQVVAIIAKQAKIEAASITPASTLKDLGVASLDAIEVIFDIEEAYDIHFPDQGPNFDTDTVQHLVDAVSDALRAKAADPDAAA